VHGLTSIIEHPAQLQPVLQRCCESCSACIS